MSPPADAITPADAEETMIVSASRLLSDGASCFVGIGLPSAAAILAQRNHAPDLFLVYESGALGPRPGRLPLSVADTDLVATAQTIVPVPEIFNYWVQPGRIDLGLLGAGQVDRFGNLNSTVVGGDYARPKVRLPGAGGAPEIAAGCRQIIVIIRQTRRSFVRDVDFVTSLGHKSGAGDRSQFGFPGDGPSVIVTDIGHYRPHPGTKELVLTHLQPNATLEQARENAGWEVLVAPQLEALDPPQEHELTLLRALRNPATA